MAPPSPPPGAVVTLGTFDGLHRGHQAVLAEVKERARAKRLASVLVTFDPHPLAVVNPAAAPKLLTLPDEKRELVAAQGIEQFVVLPFTPAVAQLDAEAFVRRLCDEYAMRELVMGYDHGFGRGRAGDVELVQRLGSSEQFGVSVVAAVRDDGQPISSTLIRTALAHGDLDSAARWLGRPYAIRGTVVRGAGRGRTIGVPTLNLESPNPSKLLPPDGVYAARVVLQDGRTFGGMMNQGPRPTFGEDARALEVHLFDFDEELYGRHLRVCFLEKLRDEEKYAGLDELKAAIARDVKRAREYFARHG